MKTHGMSIVDGTGGRMSGGDIMRWFGLVVVVGTVALDALQVGDIGVVLVEIRCRGRFPGGVIFIAVLR